MSKQVIGDLHPRETMRRAWVSVLFTLLRFASRRARTQSAISAAEIEITNPDQQKQAIAGLNRGATNLNGRVDKTPDIQQSLQNQGELMSAMRDAGEAVARRIGDVADAKRDALLQAASESDDPQQKQQYLAEAEQWDESGRYRVGLQSAGGSLVGGIGGGLLGAAQSGAGSLVSALLANKLDAVSRQIADQKPTGNADLDKTLGNIVANVMSSVAGGVVGGTQGAQAAYNVDRFNRQLHPQEKALAQQLAEKSGDKYSQQQIEDQMRQMSMTEGGQTYAGSPDTLIGEQRPTDAEAKWVYAGETADGKPILTQATVRNNAELQRYIVDAMSSSDVPSTISYTAAPMQPELGPRRYALKPPAKPCATAECAAGLAPAGMLYYPPDLPKEQIADTAAALSAAAGRFGATTGAIAAIPSPYAPAATTLTLSAAMVDLGASAVEQVFRPNPVAFGVDSFIDLGTFTATEKYPLWGPVINELGNYIKGSDWVIKQKNSEILKK